MVMWSTDILGEQYQSHEIELGTDPDGEGEIFATLIRHREIPANGTVKQAVIYVHGFTDYFFQTELAEFFVERGVAFYALDLRKCGRSRREGQTPHYISDLSLYDAELEEAVKIVESEHPGAKIVMGAHSTGGLIVPLWLDRVNQRPGGVDRLGINGLFLNSPWFDLQGDAITREVGTPILRLVGPALGKRIMPLKLSGAYGRSLHLSADGTWEYDLNFKPLDGFPVRFGWITAVRRGHAELHRGLEVSVPSLVLRSSRSHVTGKLDSKARISDIVLDVRQIAKWAGCLGGKLTSLPIRNAMHDVFLSEEGARAEAYAALADWWDRWIAADN